MRKTGILILLAFLPYFIVYAQEPTFSKTVESSMLSFIKKAWNPEGYWFFMDNTRIMKVDALGNKKWEKTFSSDPQLVLKNITYAGANRFLITAFHFTTEALHFFTVDPDGNITASFTAAGQATYGEHIFIGQDSLLVVGQRNNTGGQSTGFADLFDSRTGSLLWSYSPTEHAIAYIGAARINKNVIALYGNKGGAGFGHAALTTIYTNGLEKWNRTYSAPSVNVVCLDVAPAGGGSMVALLWKGSSSELIGVSPDGDLKNTLPLRLAVAHHIMRSPHDGTFVVSGTSRDRIFLTRLDESFRIQWWRYYGTATRSEFGDAVQGMTHHLDASLMLWGASRRDNQSFPFVICTNLDGQVANPLPEAIKEPQRTIRHLPGDDTGGEPQLFTSQRDDDENIIVGGSSYKDIQSQSQPVSSGLVAKLNPAGDTLWTKDISSLLGTSTSYTYLVANSRTTSSGNYVFLLQSRNQTLGSAVLYLGADGELLWNSTSLAGKRADLAETAPGEYLVCGHAFDMQKYNETGVLHKVNLNTRSVTTLPVTLPGCMIHNIIPSGKGTYYVTGEQIETYKISRKGYWAEISASGAVLASTTYDLAYKTMINATTLTPAGDILCAGAVEDDKGNRDLLLMLVNASGTRLWHKTFDILNQDEAVTVKVLADGYLVAGETGKQVFGVQESFAYVARFSLHGDLEWQQFIGRPGYYSRSVDLYLDTDSTGVLIGNSEKRQEGLPRFGSMGFLEKISFSGVTVTGIDDKKHEHPEVYPNPFNEKFTVKCPGGCAVTLLTMQGQVVTAFTNPKQTLPFSVDTRHLMEGIYIADIRDHRRHYRIRVIKVRQ